MGWRLESRWIWLKGRGNEAFTVDVKAWRVRVFIPASESWYFEQGSVRDAGGIDDLLGGLFDAEARPILVFQTFTFAPVAAAGAACGGYVRQDFLIEGDW